MSDTEVLSRELTQAAAAGDAETVERLLLSGADIDATVPPGPWNPLHAAIEHEQIACVQVLLRHGADLERHGGAPPNDRPPFTPLAHAVDIAIDGTLQSGGQPGAEPTDLIQLLLIAGADPQPGLRVAQRYRSQKVIDLLTLATSRQPTAKSPPRP